MTLRFVPVIMSLALAGAAAGQISSFTYQGHLQDGGQPAAGLHDFRFRLFDAPTGGNPVGVPACADNVDVVAGLFTVEIDFGPVFAAPAPRYMRVEVRRDAGQPCSIPFTYVELSPRQKVNSVPAATHANSAFSLAAADGAPTNALVVDNEGRVGIGTAGPTAPLHVSGGPVVAENTGDQADLLWLASERSWVFRQERTGAGTALKLQSVGGGGNKEFMIHTDGPVTLRSTRGDNYVPGGVESLRIVRGRINADGTIAGGEGFSVVRSRAGFYDVTFDFPFVDIPAVTASPVGVSRMVAATNLTPSSASLIVVTRSDGFPSDSSVSFIAVGLR